jgi:hypothetical protein
MNPFENRRNDRFIDRAVDAPAGGEEPPIPGLAGLRKPGAPSRDLWPGIDSRIRARQLRRQRAPWLAALGIAASLLLVLSASVGLQDLRGRRAPLHAPSNWPIVATAGDNNLLPASNRMHPETRALVKIDMKIVDGAENQIRRAIAADPDDAYLKSLLAATRQQQDRLHIVLADAR